MLLSRMKKYIFILFGFNWTLCSAQINLTASEKNHKIAGDVLVTSLPAIALGSTLIWKDDQKGTLQFAKTLATTALSTYALKLIINKERPNGESLNSFPSGHTSIAFASAGFMQKRYGWKVGIPAYALAGYVGYSRIKANKHDGWDVLAGAILGTGIAYLFTNPLPEKKDIKITLGNVKSYTSMTTVRNYTTLKLIYKF